MINQQSSRQAVEAADATGVASPLSELEASSVDQSASDVDAAATPKLKKKKTKLGLRIEHQTAGRVRMKVASAKGNTELLQEIGKTFGVIPGIERVTVNPTTGSVVLHYDADQHAKFHHHFRSHCDQHGCEAPPPTNYDELANRIEREAEFLAEHSHTAKLIVHICKHIDREIKLKTNNTVDLKIGLAGAIIGLTLFELGASAATPVWLTLGVFTLNHFVELQQHHALEEKVDKAAPVIVKGDNAPPNP